MKKPSLFMIYSLWAIGCYSQEIPKKIGEQKEQQKQLKKMDKEERRNNIYANRKYSFSISESSFANVSQARNIETFGAFDFTFSDRIAWLDLGKNGSLETNTGISFQRYQGTKLSLGFDYELLSKKHKANLLIGWQYSLGLAQATSLDGNAFINLGFHNYLMPFIGIMWWPGKEDKTASDTASVRLYENPRFWQLFFLKFQVGYSYLLNNLQIDTIGAFKRNLYDVIKNNTSNTLNVKLGIGINIPTSGEKRRKYFYLLENRR